MSEFVEELNNILTHKYVKNYQVIMDVDEKDRHIACHYLFSYYPYDLFFVEVGVLYISNKSILYKVCYNNRPLRGCVINDD
jgi:hypothetical protein